jgi:hypothetical protein
LRVSELIQKENPSYEELAELGTLVRLGIIEYQARGGNGDSFLGEAFLVLGRTGRNPRRHRRRDLENMEDLPNA